MTARLRISATVETKTEDGLTLEWSCIQVAGTMAHEIGCARVPTTTSTEAAMAEALSVALRRFRQANGIHAEQISPELENGANVERALSL